MIQVATIPALSDNYCYLVWREGSRRAVVIDPSESEPLSRALRERGLVCGLILNTHHHHDHVGGNLALRDEFSCEIWCSDYDLARVPGATRGLREGETFVAEGVSFDVWDIPGHTLGQVAYYVREASSLFVGDTMFSMGCGRLFEGTAAQMHASLSRLMSAPSETRLHVGHEYTSRNGAFALSVEPGNLEIVARIDRARALGRVVPSPTVADELRVNPFVRCSSPEIRSRLGFGADAADLAIFTKLREIRNSF